MPATPIRRRRPAAALAAVVLGLGLLAGCAGQQAPGNYSDKVERNFLAGCTKTATDDGSTFEDGTPFDADEHCGCIYDALSAENDGLDFDRFKKINDDLVENPGPLPDEMQAFADACRQDPSGDADADIDQDATTTTEG